MPAPYTDITFTNAREGGITAKKLNKLRDDLSTAISSGGAGTGDMTKAVYDTNGNNVVDTCDSLAWGKLTGVPVTFPPDSTAMLKSVYDANSDNIVDHAALADSATAVAWTGVTGKPSTFPPDSTAMLKSVYDTNNNGKVDTCDALPWTSVTGQPAIPAPSSTTPAMDGTAAIGAGTTYARNDHVHPSDTSRLSTAGGTVTGQITIQPSSGVVCLTLAGNPTDGWAQQYFTKASGSSGVGCAIVTTTGTPTGYRWALSIGDSTVESGSNAGSDFKLEAYSDAAASLGVALKILRASLTATFGGPVILAADPASALGAATKQYVDAKSTGTVNPGSWTNLSYGTGWTQNTTAQYRVEVNGTFSKVIAQGLINYASGAASLAFTLPAGARPGVTRGCVLAGFDSSGDVLLFNANVSVAGAVTILPMVRQSFVWPSATNGSVYLDNLSFAL
jgi:hypothetical protein